MRALLGWVVLIVLLSGAGLLAGSPGAPGFVLSALTLGVALVAGVVLLAWIRLSRRK